MKEYPPSLSSDTLDDFLRQRPYSLIHFDAKWDNIGHTFQNRIREITPRFSDAVNFGFVDIDEQQDLARAHKIMTIPSSAYYRGGEFVTLISALNQDVETNLNILISGDTPDGTARIPVD